MAINMELTRCVDPVVKYCQGCRYGWVQQPDWIETREDIDGCCFESGCMYGIRNCTKLKEVVYEYFKH